MVDTARERIFPNALKKSLTKTALVAGGAGFIGSYICEELLARGFSVICVDNLDSGNRENIKNLSDNPNFSFIKADINSPEFTIPQEIRVDIIFHAAGIEEFSVDKTLSLGTLLVNSLGARALLELAKAKNAKFIFISTANLYSGVFSSTSLKYYFGKDQKSESTFTHNEAKRFAEALVFEYFKNYNLYAIITRVKDVYGPRMTLQAEGDINSLIRSAVEGKKLIVAGEGLKTINPAYISDVSKGIVKAGLEGTKGEIYNLINPQKTTIEALAQTIKQVVGRGEINHTGKNEDIDIPYHQLDTSTSLQKLNWHPTTNLVDGVTQTIVFFHQNSKETPKRLSNPLFAQTPQGLGKATTNAKRSTFVLKHLRLIIFLASLILVLITVVYPGAALVYNTYVANRSFESSIKNLEVDKVKESKHQADSAESSYRRANQNFQNIEWLLKIITSEERFNILRDFYFVGEKLSSTASSISQAQDILINKASVFDSLTDQESQDFLDEIDQKSLEARVNLDLGKASLESFNENRLPKGIRDDFSTLNEGKDILEEILTELEASTAS